MSRTTRGELGQASTPAIPVARNEGEELPAEELRLRHRVLDLRRPELQKNLLLRHRLLQRSRQTLSGLGFFEIETPILLTSTLNVPRVADALIDWMLTQPGSATARSINVLVGETNDGVLNDIQGRHSGRREVYAALAAAKEGPVEEGAVGAGTGTICYGVKGGIGTSSRVVPESAGGYCTEWCDPDAQDCGPDAVCAALAGGTAALGFCLAACETSDDCREGHDCTEYAAGSACSERSFE